MEALAAKYGPLLHRIAQNILLSGEDARECVNDAYLGIWNAIPPQRPEPLCAFVCAVTRNQALKRLCAAGTRKRSGYHTDQVWLDDEGHMHYEGLDKNDWTVYDRAHTLWNSDQRQILLHLTSGRRLWLLYNPSVKSLMIHNSYFALSDSACETLSALFQVS